MYLVTISKWIQFINAILLETVTDRLPRQYCACPLVSFLHSYPMYNLRVHYIKNMHFKMLQANKLHLYLLDGEFLCTTILPIVFIVRQRSFSIF